MRDFLLMKLESMPLINVKGVITKSGKVRINAIVPGSTPAYDFVISARATEIALGVSISNDMLKTANLSIRLFIILFFPFLK